MCIMRLCVQMYMHNCTNHPFSSSILLLGNRYEEVTRDFYQLDPYTLVLYYLAWESIPAPSLGGR